MKRISIIILSVCSALFVQAEEVELPISELSEEKSLVLVTNERDVTDDKTEKLTAVDQEYAAVYKLPTWLQLVTTACEWQSKSQDNMSGYVRIVLGQLPEGDRVYLQWIKKSSAVGKPTVISTREVEELSATQLRLKGIQTEIHKNYCSISSAAAEFDQRRHYQLTIKVFEPGRYEFEKTTHLGVAAY